MNKPVRVIFALMIVCWAAPPAKAERMTASCASLLSISAGEADLVYYQAQADLGSETANRLWASYHRIKYQCAGNPKGRVIVNVEPRVRAFLEAHR
jgi:hypothetical protein